MSGEVQGPGKADHAVEDKQAGQQQFEQEEAELVCVEVLKVFDFVFQQEEREDICVNIPASAGPLPDRATVQCTVVDVQCVEMPPRQFFPPPREGFANVTLLFTVKLQFQIIAPDGRVVFTFQHTFTFMKTVTLCAPKGTEVQCEVVNQFCGPTAITPLCQICTELVLCVIIQSKARVKLLIPAFGFCQPRPGMVLPKPVVECPPPDLFPPQCPPFDEVFGTTSRQEQ